MIIIDGRQSSMSISNYANLEEILVSATADIVKDQRIVTDVLVNEELFSEIYPHQAEDIDRQDIRSVEIRSVPFKEMALDVTEELFKVTRMMRDGSRQVAQLFRQADDAQALEMFQDLLDVTRDFMSTVAVIRREFDLDGDEKFSALIERVSELLGEISEVLANEDWILLADMLEFEFSPVCSSWHDTIENMRDHIKANLELEPA